MYKILSTHRNFCPTFSSLRFLKKSEAHLIFPFWEDVSVFHSKTIQKYTKTYLKKKQTATNTQPTKRKHRLVVFHFGFPFAFLLKTKKKHPRTRRRWNSEAVKAQLLGGDAMSALRAAKEVTKKSLVFFFVFFVVVLSGSSLINCL